MIESALTCNQKSNLITRKRYTADPLEQPATILAIVKVAGIYTNSTYRANFICPRDCLQLIKKESLLTVLLESTNEPYAIANVHDDKELLTWGFGKLMWAFFYVNDMAEPWITIAVLSFNMEQLLNDATETMEGTSRWIPSAGIA
jgi:hypothetical protein